ncbi:hypothetical protein [Bradyrhizobium ivorense]|uniref:hypothetical protein n=1 Tax=Bradyrhizobium ivorense TaxID=2511166 RepID=UPI00111720C2|nr:hypothetical protein [Bradyrhizobium ivorense]
MAPGDLGKNWVPDRVPAPAAPAQLPPPRRARPDTVDANLAVGRAKVDASETFEEAAAHLSPREVFSILNDGSVLSTVLQKP